MHPCDAIAEENASVFILEHDKFVDLIHNNEMWGVFNEHLTKRSEELNKNSTAFLITKLQSNLKNSKMMKMRFSVKRKKECATRNSPTACTT